LVTMIQEHLPVQGVEVRLRRRLGNIATVLFSAVTIEFEGEPCMLAMTLDITYNKSVERELKQTAERYRELFENSGTGILIIDDRGTYLMANVKAAAFFGKLPEELIGRSMFEFLAPDNARQHLEFNRQLLESGGHREYEDRFPGTEGERRFLIIDQCLRDEAGKNVAIQSISIDITERRQAEEALQKNGQRLHALSQRLLDVQETERKHIAYQLHDEIGQILTAVKLNLHGIRQFENVEDIPKKINENLALIDHSLQRVRDLAVDLHPWMLDQLGLVPSLRWHIDQHAQRSRLNIQFRTGNIEQRFPVDIEIACFRVVQEALTNIIRHAHATEVIVSLSMEHDALSVEVSDNGVGFEIDSITVEPGSARGFGLMSMEERVALLDGTFEMFSIMNKGTTIRFRLPLPRTTVPTTINDSR
jgi:PAS domain S-box-containing protein